MSDALELWQAGEEDAWAIRELTRAAYAKWVPVIGREPKPMMADYAEAVRSHRIDLLYADGELAAHNSRSRPPTHREYSRLAGLSAARSGSEADGPR